MRIFRGRVTPIRAGSGVGVGGKVTGTEVGVGGRVPVGGKVGVGVVTGNGVAGVVTWPWTPIRRQRERNGVISDILFKTV